MHTVKGSSWPVSRARVRRPFFLLAIFLLFYTAGVVFVMQMVFLTSVQTKETAQANVNFPGENAPIVKVAMRLISTLMANSSDNEMDFQHFLSVRGNIAPPLFANESGENVVEYTDWNNYTFMEVEAKRTGQGEQGAAYIGPSSSQEAENAHELEKKYNYNVYASDHISLERSIGDMRTEVCKKKEFMKNLPEKSVSIITIFHNERNSTLLRTVHSFVNRSPAKLVREIILVDDVSTDEALQVPLEKYINEHFTNVRIIRNTERGGLIKSRMAGAEAASGEYLFFFDAHVEVNHNYLPPLLEPLVENYRTIVCPMMDIIDQGTLQIKPLHERERGAFSWDLVYRRLPVFQEDETKPHPVPTMLGAAFGISRRWWDEIGRFDPGLQIWGGEQYEITFKSWLCGGRVVDAPCSRVAHLFRPLPYLADVTKDNRVDTNFLRVITVWMDEYKEYVLQRREDMRGLEPGDLSDQFALKERLKCKSFKWYLTEVAPDILQYFPVVEPPNKAWGRLRNNHDSSLCVMVKGQGFAVTRCESPDAGTFAYDWKMHFRTQQGCFSNPGDKYLILFECLIFEHKVTQQFVWNQDSGRIVNLFTRRCVDMDASTSEVLTMPCDVAKLTQTWTFENINSALVNEAWDKHRADLDLGF